MAVIFPLHDSSLPYHLSSPEVRRERRGKNNRHEKKDVRLVSLYAITYRTWMEEVPKFPFYTSSPITTVKDADGLD